SDLYRTLGTRLLKGRLFTDTDSRTAPWAVIINQAFARKYFPDQDPLGQRVRTETDGPHKFSTIVGVVEDTRQRSIADAVEPEIDLCYRQLKPDDGFARELGSFAQVAVRTKIDPASVISDMRAVFQQLHPDLPTNISTMEEVVDKSLVSQTLVARLVGIFAASALLIAIIGLYGLLSYNVTRSTRDIAVRLALGATRSNVIMLVIRHAVFVLGVGVLLGFAVWSQTVRLLRSYLYGVGTHDISTLIAIPAVLIACGLLASYIPARRASLVDPMTSLRNE
ncbi:MAG: FtsX-like permease family protein, partial [Pyrinomonadaceae bacterium]